MAPPLALVILAAGASRRLGRCKALVPLAGSTPLALLARAGARSSDRPVLVITGADHDAIAAALPAGLEAARNDDWAAGRTGSVVLARTLRPGCDLCLAPVDVPLVPERVFAALAACWRAQGSPAEGWLAPYLAAGADPERNSASKDRGPRFGHPVIVGRDLAARVQDLAPERPLSELRSRAQPLLALEVDAREVLDDLDTEADLARLAARSPR